MTFRMQTKSDILEEITAKMEIHSTKSAANADRLSLVVWTCKRNPEVRPSVCDVQ